MADSFASAHFNDAAAIFDKHAREAPLESALLRSRIFLKRDEPASVIGLLASRKTTDKALRAQVHMLLAAANATMKRYSEADEDFEAALRFAKLARDRDLLAELAYRRAFRYIRQDRTAEARADIAEARKNPSRRAQVNASEAESFLLAAERRYLDQARLLEKLLENLDTRSDEFVESRAWATHTLAGLARELHIPHVVPLVERHLESGDWPSDLAINQFQGFKAIGWTHALRGDYFNAFRYLKRSLKFAPGKEWIAMALADRAYLANCIGEPRWSRQELAEAEDAAADIDWESKKGEEPIVLLLMAELFAHTDPGRAAYYVARFDELGPVKNRLLHFFNDARAKTLADYSRATAEIALGNKKRGVNLLTSAEQFFTEIRYDWRAGRCALDLYHVTRDPTHLQRTSVRLRDYMSSWLGDRLRQLSSGSRQITLPPMQQKVFDGICRGLSNAEIAREMGRSEFTVANHVKVLLKTFGVSSRSALLAMQLGERQR